MLPENITIPCHLFPKAFPDSEHPSGYTGEPIRRKHDSTGRSQVYVDLGHRIF
ncbi:hypothetical protein GYMLUDRAFT_33689 [Collybiopsis luxurians FD-317 M1]|nr:hypothetical protein GYMLUDRAFT_33689 [Collybiopsis luxurians FD-317 M1]